MFQQMKKHYARYTPELVSQITGTPKDQFLKVCEMLAATSATDKVMTICYALGWTQHSVGSQNIRTMAMIQLLLGNMGRPGGGVNALRGHANVQGITDMCAYSEVLSGYLSAPTDADVDRETYLAARTGKPLRPNQMAFTQNFPKWHTSLMKAYYGERGDEGERLRLRLAAQARRRLRHPGHLRAHAPGQDERLHRAGLQPAGRGAEQEEAVGGAGQAEVPGGDGPAGDRDERVLEELRPAQRRQARRRSRPRCSASRPAASPRRPARFTNSSRVISWKEKAVDPPGEAKPDSEIMARLFMKLREHVRQGRRHAARADGRAGLALPERATCRARPRCCARSTARRWPTCAAAARAQARRRASRSRCRHRRRARRRRRRS